GLRPDLCQRLAGDMLVLPTLDERRSDIPGLIEEFLARLKSEQQLFAEFSPAAIQFLKAAHWPGQIRELATTVKVVGSSEHGARMVDGSRPQKLVIALSTVKRYLEERGEGFGAASALPSAVADATSLVRKRPADLTEQDLRRALSLSGGNKTHA